MSVEQIDDVERLRRINQALVNRVERAMDQQGNSFSLFQTAIALDSRVRRRTDELTVAMRRLESSNMELARQKEISERANRSKTQFLAAASHDVLQPLHAAQLVLSALEDEQTGERGRQLVAQVQRSLDTMHELISTLLDISRLDAGVIRPEPESVALMPLVDSVVSVFQPIAAQKNLALRTRVGPVHVRTDTAMLRRILQNLVSNAIRYTGCGAVLIGTRRRGESVALEVIDTGCGIAESEREAIFEEFHRGTADARAHNRDEPGLGLGLSIVRRLAQALEHPLEVHSRPGHGTRFSLAMPRADAPARRGARASRPAAAQGAQARLAGRRVLIVENDASVRAAVLDLFTRWGCEVRAASCTRSALRAIADPPWHADLVLADQQLDDADLGTDLVARLRAGPLPDVPAIIVSADTGRDVGAACHEIGAAFLAKPAKPSQIRALAYHLLNR